MEATGEEAARWVSLRACRPGQSAHGGVNYTSDRHLTVHLSFDHVPELYVAIAAQYGQPRAIRLELEAFYSVRRLLHKAQRCIATFMVTLLVQLSLKRITRMRLTAALSPLNKMASQLSVRE